MKGDGKSVSLVDSQNALQRWIIGGPEIARIMAEFEVDIIHDSIKHHEQTRAVLATFAKDVKALVEGFEEIGNTFSKATCYCKDIGVIVQMLSSRNSQTYEDSSHATQAGQCRTD